MLTDAISGLMADFLWLIDVTVRVKIITGSFVTLENLFPENYRYRYRLEIRMNYHYRCNGRALDRVTKQKHRPNRQKMSKKCPKIVSSAPLENFWTFFGHFFDIFRTESHLN